MFGKNIKFILEQEYDHVWAEYGKFINGSEISNCDDAIADFWNEHNPEQVPDTKHGKYKNSLLTYDDINLSISKHISMNFK